MNVALYGRRGARWAMTERGEKAVARSANGLKIGPSAMLWDGNALTVHLDEVGAPLPRRIRGSVRVIPTALTDHVLELETAGRHRWWPIAPSAKVEVDLGRPALRWRGRGYFDTNAGAAPLEAGFREWDWSRAAHPEGTAILYDVARRDGGTGTHAMFFDKHGEMRSFDPPQRVTLPRTGWRVARRTHADGGEARVRDTLEDTPFYARSVVESKLLGQPVVGVHESLSLDRFKQPWVRLLLPFRMPRKPW